MKPHFQNRFRVLILSTCFLFISFFAYSQKGPPPPAPPPNPGLPIDGGVIYLLIAGAAYGVSKLKKS